MPSLDELIRPGVTVAFGDGVGMPAMVLGELSRAAANVGDVRLLLGWTLGALDDLDVAAFGRVDTTMSGFALRRLVDRGDVGYIPARMGTLPALVRDVLRPDVLIASVVAGPDGHRFASEVGWMRAAVDAGAVVAAVERPALPRCDAGPPLPADRVVVIGSSDAPALAVPPADITDDHRAIGEGIARLIPEGAVIQFGPGTIAEAACTALDRPVRVASGLLSDPVVGLDRRHLLIGQPRAAYLAGTAVLYDWADGRPLLHPCDVTHAPGPLGALGAPFVAINTALEIDSDGQVNVETAGGSTIGGIGGHPDFTYTGASAAGGLSIIAVTSRSRRGEPTLVERLEGPVTTPSHDVDVVVTERGIADLRGLSRPERRAALARLWSLA
ncbi:MAG TPA: acetyl-CoA hydrolase/transferase C-terminal domain-containing protein [Acidimicrobiia bacterium]|nr:acetyl-CoA hydrolase/transferase C-terminal domain-containing protein [Acidimicrobiia bacterium]